MPLENKRILVKIDRLVQRVNHDTLNPIFPELTLEDIEPTVRMVAKARASYLKELKNLTELEIQGTTITANHVKNLHYARLLYEELLSASKSYEIAIERGYLDVKHLE